MINLLFMTSHRGALEESWRQRGKVGEPAEQVQAAGKGSELDGAERAVTWARGHASPPRTSREAQSGFLNEWVDLSVQTCSFWKKVLIKYSYYNFFWMNKYMTFTYLYKYAVFWIKAFVKPS